MTCREKLKIDQPTLRNKNFYDKCPHHYGYLSKPDYCDNGVDRINCVRCWNRELPGETVNKQDPWRDIYRIIEEGMVKRDREVHVYINPETGISVNVIPWPNMEELCKQFEKGRITKNQFREIFGLPKVRKTSKEVIFKNSIQLKGD